MNINYFNNRDTLNIFCDASINKIGKTKYRGCYGAIAVFLNQEWDNMYHICNNTTNNDSEIKAIRLGVLLAIKNKEKFKHINIFSDSQISIFGIRDRIFNWKNINGVLCGYNNNPIINQSIFIEILDLIVANSVHINFWHQAGHVNNTKETSINNALHVFHSSNGIRESISTDVIKFISDWNNIVDNNSRNIIFQSNINSRYCDPVYFYPNDFYEKLDKYDDYIYSPYYSKLERR